VVLLCEGGKLSRCFPVEDAAVIRGREVEADADEPRFAFVVEVPKGVLAAVLAGVFRDRTLDGVDPNLNPKPVVFISRALATLA
jgi:hypothetical protein